MPDPAEPQEPTHDPATVAAHDVRAEPLPPPAGPPMATTAPMAAGTSSAAEQPDASEQQSHSKVKAAALLASAAAVANKVRHEAPKKVQELREKRAAGRHVILTEFEGRTIAIGPYRNDEQARDDARKVGGVPTVIELRSPTAHFGPDADTATSSYDRSPG